MPYIYRLNTKIRLTMLCLSVFELYSRWVSLKCGKNKHDAISWKLSKAQEKVWGMLKAVFMTWLFRSALLISVAFNWGITVRTTIQTIFTLTRNTLHKPGLFEATSGPLELWKYAIITTHESLNQFLVLFSITDYTFGLWCESFALS